MQNSFIKKIISTLLVVPILIVGVFGPISTKTTLAVEPSAAGTPSAAVTGQLIQAANAPANNPDGNTNPASSQDNANAAGVGVAQQTAQTAAQTQQGTNGQPTSQCSGITDIGCLITYFFSLVAWGIFFLAGRILFLAGMLLDYSIKASVLLVFSQNGTFASTLSDAINTGWGVLRDVANIFFIFILLYAGIKLIIGQEDHPGAVIKNVVIMAFLINFSLLFTKIAIDASNIVALVFYKILVPDPATGSISSLFLNGLMLNSVFNNASLTGSSYYWLAMISYLMAAVVAILAAWVFLSAAITFVIRTVTLLILMIVSPLAFVFYTFPGKEYKGKWNEWLGKLTENCVIAPAYLFLIWICAYIINAMLAFGKSTGTTTGGLGAAFSAANQVNTSNVSAYTVVFIYAIVIGLIWASLSVSKGLSKGAHALAGSIVGAAAGFALGGVGGFMGRQLIGRSVGKFAGSEALKDFGAGKGRLGKVMPTFARRGIVNATKGVAESSFDIKNSSTVSKYLGKAGLSLGSGSKDGGYEARSKKAAEVQVKFGEGLGYNKKQVEEKEKRLAESALSKEEAQYELDKLAVKKLSGPLTADEAYDESFYQAQIQNSAFDKTRIDKDITDIKKTRQVSFANALSPVSIFGHSLLKYNDRAKKDMNEKIDHDKLKAELEHKEDDWKEKIDKLQRSFNDAERDLKKAIKDGLDRSIAPLDIAKMLAYKTEKIQAESELRKTKSSSSRERKALKYEIGKLERKGGDKKEDKKEDKH